MFTRLILSGPSFGSYITSKYNKPKSSNLVDKGWIKYIFKYIYIIDGSDR